jgi:hypothetical protein
MSKYLRNIQFSVSLVLLLFCTTVNGQFYYGMQQDFGKSRVQYQDFQWSYYSFEKFDTYFYKQGRQVAQYVSKMAEVELKELEGLLDYRLGEKLQLVVYNNLTDFKQSNVGLPHAEEGNNTGGLSKIVGSRLYVYFDGDHRNLKQQLRAGISQVLLQQLMFGGNLREVVSNNTLITLPDWYEAGLVAYLSDPNDFEYEQYAIDGVLSGRYAKFKTIQKKEAVYVGFSIWKYIGDVYSPKVIGQILYMTRVNRSIESGFSFVLGKGLASLIEDWLIYSNERYKEVGNKSGLEGEEVGKKNILDTRYSSPTMNPKTNAYAYVRNYLGQYKVYYVVESKKQEIILKGGYAIDAFTDYSFPLLAWHPVGEILAIIEENEGHCQLHFYNVKNQNLVTKELFQFEKVMSVSYAPDGKHLLIAAIREGQSDIYLFSILANSFVKMTDDIYDDFDPVFLKDNRFVFASTRPGEEYPVLESDSLKPNPFTNLFQYDIGKSNPLRQITFTENLEERSIVKLGSTKLDYLSQNGRLNQAYSMSLDSSIAFIDTVTHYNYKFSSFPYTNSNRSIAAFGKDRHVLWKTFRNGKDRLLLSDVPEKIIPLPINSLATPLTETQLDGITDLSKPKEKRKFEVDITNYQFHPDLQKEFDIPNKSIKIELQSEAVDSLEEKEEFVFPAQSNYRLSFFSDYFVSQLDNSFPSTTYQPFTGGGSALYLAPPLSALLKIGLGEIFGDYKLVAAARLSFNLQSNEFYFGFQNDKFRFDRSYEFTRRVQMEQVFVDEVHRVITHGIKATLSYPFNPVSAVKLSVGGRFDENNTLALASNTTEIPKRIAARTQLLGQWVYDNTIPKGLNLYSGSRVKVFGEYYQRLSKQSRSMFVLGADFRNYYPIHRNFILANRFAASTSFGSERLIYFMGGVDNWWFAKYNPETPIKLDQNYAFQTLATNMRGFTQNVRNGNSFAVYNTELRLPLFSYLFNRPLKSDLLNNFQIVAFSDIGTAWNGLSPWSKDNIISEKEIQQGGVTVTLDRQKNPLIMGYGYGVRTRVFGYFVRLDWAWGIEDGRILDRVFYLSTTLDF